METHPKTGNGFPYFQFHIDRWLTGKISAFDLDEQGFYLNLCIQSWVAQGPFNVCLTTVQRRYRKPAQWFNDTLAAFLDVGIIEREADHYRIKFIDDQLEMLGGKRQQRVDAGLASAEARRSKRDSKSRVKKSRVEKSSTLNTRSTDVQRSLTCFDSFWQSWPSHKRKVDKPKCAKHWQAHKLDSKSAEIMAGLEAWKASDSWTKDGGKFIPAVTTWLNNERWNDLEAARAKEPEQQGIGYKRNDTGYVPPKEYAT